MNGRWRDIEEEVRRRIAEACLQPIGTPMPDEIDMEVLGHQVKLKRRHKDIYDVYVIPKHPINMISIDIVLEGPKEWEVQWRLESWPVESWNKFPPVFKSAALQCARKVIRLREQDGLLDQLTLNVFQNGRLIYTEENLPENDEHTD